MEARPADEEQQDAEKAEGELAAPLDETDVVEKSKQIIEDEFEAGESHPRRILPDPGQPTAGQVEEHRIRGHIPYRSWCRWCVEARATGEQHRGRPDERLVSRFSFDYLFITKSRKYLSSSELQQGDEVELKVLVAKDSSTKAIFGHVVPCKGSDEEGYAVGLLVDDIRFLGHKKLELKSDNEKAILKVLKDSLTSLRFEVADADTLQEEHAVPYDSNTNGDAENAVKQLQKQLRTVKLCLESRVRQRIPNQHPLLSWLVEHAAWMLTTLSLGPDGFTSYQRVRGRDFGKRLVGFGERVLYMLPKKGPEHDARGKLDAMWEYGVVVGYSRTSAEYLVKAEAHSKVVKARSLQRVPEAERWRGAALEAVDVSVQDYRERRPARAVQIEGFRNDSDVLPEPQNRSKTQRVAFYREDYVKHGETEGCKKCESNRRNGYNLNAKGEKSTMVHSERCRTRMEAALESTETGQRRLRAARERVDAWMARRVEAADARVEGEKQADGPSAAEAPPTSRAWHDRAWHGGSLRRRGRELRRRVYACP